MGKRATEWLCCVILCFCMVVNADTAMMVQYPEVSYVLGKNRDGEGIGEVADQLMSFQSPLFSYVKDRKEQQAAEGEDPAYDRIRADMDQQPYAAEDYEELQEGHQGETSEYQEYASSREETSAVQAETQEETVPETEPQTEAQEAAAPQIAYSMEQLQDYQFLVDNMYFIHPSTSAGPDLLDAASMLAYDARMTTSSDQPQILIYHTHASEYFADSDESDPNTLIVGVGNVLADILRDRYGFNVIHDTTLFPYQQAYSQGLQKITEILEQYPSIEVVIDLHRDAAAGQHLVTEVNGKQTAQIMFFNGISRSTEGPIDYLENPYLPENLAFSFQLKTMADTLYPGLARKNYLKSYRYNLHMRPKSVLIEVGAETNTFEEEVNAMEPLAEILASVLLGE